MMMLSQSQDFRREASLVEIEAAEEPFNYRFHLQQGPIDLVIDLRGRRAAVMHAEHKAQTRFATILEELVQELDLLRQPLPKNKIDSDLPQGSVAQKMWAAVRKFDRQFITPMAAVAGAVADEILGCLSVVTGLQRAIVNNGGDIALWGVHGQTFDIGLIDNPVGPHRNDTPTKVTFSANKGVQGVATSGWRGRSQSLGIADAVTVFAADAATADAAATLIANEVNVESCSIIRAPANHRYPDSDLGEQLVTVDVLPLTPNEVSCALRAGASRADVIIQRSDIHAVIIALAGQLTYLGSLHSPSLSTLANVEPGVW